MRLGPIQRRPRHLHKLALLGSTGMVFAIITGCNPEVVTVVSDALEGGLLAGIPSLFEWIREGVRQDEVDDTVPTVLLETFQALRAMLA